jgi:hypothetical protein
MVPLSGAHRDTISIGPHRLSVAMFVWVESL